MTTNAIRFFLVFEEKGRITGILSHPFVIESDFFCQLVPKSGVARDGNSFNVTKVILIKSHNLEERGGNTAKGEQIRENDSVAIGHFPKHF